MSNDYLGIPPQAQKPFKIANVKLNKEALQKTIAYLVVQNTDMQQQISQLTNNWNELEKDINNQLMMTRKFDDYNEGYFDATLHYYNKMKEIKEGNNE